MNISKMNPFLRCEALIRLREERVPFIFMTNGGIRVGHLRVCSASNFQEHCYWHQKSLNSAPKFKTQVALPSRMEAITTRMEAIAQM